MMEIISSAIPFATDRAPLAVGLFPRIDIRTFKILARYPTLVVLSCQNFLPRVRPILRVWLSCEIQEPERKKKKDEGVNWREREKAER